MYTKTDTQSGKYISVITASEVVGRTQTDIEQLCRVGKIQSKIIAGEWYVAENSLCEYFNITLATPVLSASVRGEGKKANERGVPSAVPFSTVLSKTVNVLTAITLVFGGYYVTSTVSGRSAGAQIIGYVQKTLDKTTDMMAYVGYGIFNTVQQPANTLLALENILYPKAKKTVAQSSGLLVMPTTGDSDSDKMLREKIRNSFSDEVEVISDTNGRSGIVRPVFKNTVGKSYMYVLVPVGD